MRKAALLYNPESGGSRKRQRELDAAVSVFRSAGIEVELTPTESRGHGEQAARQAMADDCDTIFACGGDGTIHNIAQALANSQVALGILPMGTANALAHDLGLPLDVMAAAKAALDARPKRVALGKVEYADLQGKPCSRYFVIAAGIGVDAHLFYKLHTGRKQRMGMAAYYAKAWNLWFSYSMPRFSAEYTESGSNKLKRAEPTELLAVRIRNFGGILRELAPGASLDRNDLRVVFCCTASRSRYLAYVARGLLRRQWAIPGINLAHCTMISCRNLVAVSEAQRQRRIYVEADGELLGTLPVQMTVVPYALTLLAPSR